MYVRLGKKNNFKTLDTILSLVQLVCLKIFITSPGCFLKHWVYPLIIWIIANCVREIFAPWGQCLFIYFFLRLEQNQFGGVSKQWGGWKRNSTFELEIRREQCPCLDCSETGDYVFDHNVNSTLSQGEETWVNMIENMDPPQSLTAWDRFKRSSFKDEALIWKLM